MAVINRPLNRQDFKTLALAATALIRGIMNGEFHIHFSRRFTNWLRFARLLPYRGYFYLIHKFTGL